MSDESRKDVVLETTDDSTSGGSPGAPTGPVGSDMSPVPNDMSDDDVMELGVDHMVADDDAEDDVAVAAPSSPPHKAALHDIPMARISLLPSTGGASAASNAHDVHEELFELQEGHVVEEGVAIPDEESDRADHNFDFGTPAMVFDGDAHGANITAAIANATDGAASNSDIPRARDAQLPQASIPEGQPAHAFPVNQPQGDSSDLSGARHDSSDLIAAPGNTPSRISQLKAQGKRVSVDDLTAAVFDDEPVDDGPRESTLDNYVGYMARGDSAGPAMNSPETAFPGVQSPPSDESDAVEMDGVDDLDIDITEEVEEMVDGTATSAGGGQKPPPPPPPAGSGRPVNSFFKNDKIDAANASLKLMAKTARKSRGKKREWWATIFDDEYLMLLPERSPYEQQKQIDFIQRYLGLPPGALLLDLACGNGRNSIGMAQRNYRIVGVDLSLSMLARAGDAAQEAGQKINFIHGDMRDLGFDKTFDGVFSLDTSFGYFDEPTNVKVLQGIYRALKPGGTFLLELANRDFVIRQQPNMVWFQMDNMVCMEETDFNYINNRLYISRQLIIGDNEKQSKHEFSLRLYSLHEIGQLLHQAGFAVIKVSGHRATPGAFFGPESSKLIIIAERRGD
ncbi:MAG: class I SAM-dependent methyltransferase [Deltaproteobacteria bacterium]|nr:class I SAM-dependent methyltransferase [Deltaproteobacteria bacterium]